jgi:hypothetical protein
VASLFFWTGYQDHSVLRQQCTRADPELAFGLSPDFMGAPGEGCVVLTFATSYACDARFAVRRTLLMRRIVLIDPKHANPALG